MKASALLVALLLCGPLAAQPDMATALVVRSDGGSGSCVVVDRTAKLDDGWQGLAVTAYHVVEGQSSVRVKYRSGRSCSLCAVVAFSREADVAIIRVWMPDDVLPVELTADVPVGGVLLLGYPGGGGQDSLGGGFLRRLGDYQYFDILVRPGFSGGGVFSGDKLAGCISGGWLWTKDERGRQATWPTRAASGRVIAELLDKARHALNP